MKGLKLLAWIISEGTLEITRHGSPGRITIYQSKIKKEKNYNEIILLLNKLNLIYKERDSTPSLGESVKMIRLDNKSSKKILKLFDENNIKHIPKKLFKSNLKQANLFLDTYIKGDGSEECKISTRIFGFS